MATDADLLVALRAAHFALAEAASHLKSREGFSSAYRRASNASDAARDVLISYQRLTDIEQDQETMRMLADIADPNN